MKGSDADINFYQKIEREVRTPQQRLLIDAFLWPPEVIESEFTPPPALEEPAISEPTGFVQALRAEDPVEEPAPRREPRAPATGQAKTLEEEIDDFMNRDGAALSPEPES